MKILRFALVLQLLSGLVVSSWAEECTPLSQEVAKKHLASLQDRYAVLKGLRASFTQRSYLKSLDLEEESSGSLTVQIPGKLFWEYASPEPQVFLLKDDTFQLYQPLEKQLIIQDTKQFFLSDIPVSFLLGLGDVAKDFSLKSGCKEGNTVRLTLTPKPVQAVGGQQFDRSLQALTLSFELGEFLPTSAVIEDVEENRTTVVISKRETDPQLAENTFVLSVPDGTDIQDLRRQ